VFPRIGYPCLNVKSAVEILNRERSGGRRLIDAHPMDDARERRCLAARSVHWYVPLPVLLTSSRHCKVRIISFPKLRILALKMRHLVDRPQLFYEADELETSIFSEKILMCPHTRSILCHRCRKQNANKSTPSLDRYSKKKCPEYET
jgi:hypothetical protein